MKNLITLLLTFLWLQFGFGQTTWYQVQTGFDNQLNCIDFPTKNVGYIGGNDSLLLKTTDGGQNWTQIDFSGVTIWGGGEHVLDLNFINENIGYMTVGPYGANYKTTDGGLNWTALTVSGNLCYVGSSFFFSEDDGFLGGTGCFEGELIDIVSGSGATTQATMNDNGLGGGPSEMITQIDFLNANYGLASSSGGRIFRTTDAGQNWDSIPVGLPAGVPVTSVKIIDDTLAYAGYDDLGSGFGLLISADAGLTWAMDLNSWTFYYPAFYDIIQTNLGHIYVGCETSFAPIGVIFENKGSFWNYTSVDQPIYAMTSHADSVVWGVGDSGYVVVNVLPATLSFDNSSSESIDLNVFPNPCSEILSLQTSENVLSGSIYNMSGKTVKFLSGISQQIDVSDLENGVYLLQLQFVDKVETMRFVKE